ncbi:MFS transporter [Halosquirtibacter laminarini]|uniref:MFS transporter n=1 Tax=Halosquirtibacter laminarini TaxID=3374600 RepID=A0AC61NGJ5_9BACT|nr:MFS transporter [Prolixibacteraceae bacterium]
MLSIKNIRFTDPRKWPFFYGWVIMVMTTLGLFVSIPGQTMAVSAFTDSLIDALNISRNQLSTTYMIGTITSAFLLKRAGLWYDRYGAKVVMFLATLTMSFAMLGMANLVPLSNVFAENLFHLFSAKTWSMILLSLFFFLARLNGQGIMSMVARNMLMKWFFRKRGFANGISSMVANALFAMATVILAYFVSKYQWDVTYCILAVILFVASILFLGTYEDNPESFGLLPDGKKYETQSVKKEKSTGRDFTYNQAIRTRAFWSVTLITAFFGCFVTGFTFHIFSIFRDANIPWERGQDVFIYSAILSTLLSFGGSVISDHIKTKYLVLLAAVGGLMCGIGLAFVSNPMFFIILIVGYGTIGGLFGVLLTVAHPGYFGKKHLGAITGRNMSLIIFGSAVSPLLFSLSKTYFDSYLPVSLIFASLALLIFLFTLTVKEPQ